MYVRFSLIFKLMQFQKKWLIHLERIFINFQKKKNRFSSLNEKEDSLHSIWIYITHIHNVIQYLITCLQ